WIIIVVLLVISFPAY
ncbi:type I toxin-antitoxin system Ibs family toxin, partial [Escherichia coli]|nr:type I toxin-antitoxin system Ibs family toxin [Escherichia coli]EJP7008270.1 type I toxin-antitoxin system Ibs family toxin [Escherichia coli]EKK4593379.1 type I toxin-antitoxin system Ibs family toxin [Escherichia coli]HAV7452111.1 type I toxin-antitoxin system Ibs family toxin [Escherichia coli]HCN6305150.1 type I toxin-antitoxin system Ibs family toxin [Escherichia coli]